MDFFDIKQERTEVEAILRSSLQEAGPFRFLRRSRKLSALFVEEGAAKALEVLKPYSYPLSFEDEYYTEHVEFVLRFLEKSEEAKLFLRRLTLPLASPFVENMVRHSLLLPPHIKLEDRHAKMAVVSALLTPLRQSVGSCFATAPAIVLQQEAPERLLEDLYDLVTTGRLKRVIDGQEYKVPMSLKTGYGDLRKTVSREGILGELPSIKEILPSYHEEKNWFPCTIEEIFRHLQVDEDLQVRFKSVQEHPLLKIWEYTIASFSDFKTEFYKWNLFASLGFNHEEAGGIGEKIYQMLHLYMGDLQKQAEKMREEAIILEDQIRATELLLRNAYSEDKIRRLKVELQMRERQYYICRDLYEEGIGDVEEASKFFQFLIDQFMLLFPQYFQELYDPEMYEVPFDIYEDMPAGFRLIYKHGRYDPSVWTSIYTKEEYLQSLSDFIYMVEPQIISACGWKKGREKLPEICHEIVQFFHEPTFLESATQRIARMHKKTMVGVQSILQKETPWAYSSGGSLVSLLKCYFGLKNEPQKEEITPDDPRELASFFTEIVKDLPLRLVGKKFLISSSTHAFSLEPKLFKKAWEDSGNTHTWLRDFIFNPQEKFYRSLLLSGEEIRFLSHRLGVDVTAEEELHLKEFAAKAGKNLDGFFREAFPLIRYEKIVEFSERIRRSYDISISEKEEKKWLEKRVQGEIFLYKEMHRLLEEMLTFFGFENTYSVVHSFLPKPPEAFLFADTNWANSYFGILFSAGSDQFDLWRLNSTGIIGSPMTSWRNLGTWTLYTTPFL